MKFKKYSTIVEELNSTPIEIQLSIIVDQDDFPVEGSVDFGNEEQNKEYLERFERGDLFNGLIVVKASTLGVTEQDCMGGCHIRLNHFEDDIQDIINGHEMVKNAVDQLKLRIVEQANKLKGFAS